MINAIKSTKTESRGLENKTPLYTGFRLSTCTLPYKCVAFYLFYFTELCTFPFKVGFRSRHVAFSQVLVYFLFF